MKKYGLFDLFGNCVVVVTADDEIMFCYRLRMKNTGYTWEEIA